MQHLYDQVAVTLVIVKYKTNTSWANLALFGGQNSCQRIHITWNNKKTWGKGREGKGREGKGREGKGREGKGREGKGREGKGREGKGNNRYQKSLCSGASQARI